MKACPCGSTRIAPSNARNRYYVCAKCIYRRAHASSARYRRTEKCRTARARYDKSPKGRIRSNKTNAKRVELGGTVIYAKTLEQRDEIRALIKRKLAEFKQRSNVTE
jgi:hypothetical protein